MHSVTLTVIGQQERLHLQCKGMPSASGARNGLAVTVPTGNVPMEIVPMKMEIMPMT